MEARYCKHCGRKLKPSDTERCMKCFIEAGGRCEVKNDLF